MLGLTAIITVSTEFVMRMHHIEAWGITKLSC